MPSVLSVSSSAQNETSTLKLGVRPGLAQRLQREDDARNGALHVGSAAAIHPALLHHGIEGAVAISGNGDNVKVGIEMDGLFRAGVPTRHDVIARVIQQLGLGLP